MLEHQADQRGSPTHYFWLKSCTVSVLTEKYSERTDSCHGMSMGPRAGSGTVCHRLLAFPWPAWNHTATSFLRNTISVYCNTVNKCIMIYDYQKTSALALSRGAWFWICLLLRDERTEV